MAINFVSGGARLRRLSLCSQCPTVQAGSVVGSVGAFPSALFLSGATGRSVAPPMAPPSAPGVLSASPPVRAAGFGVGSPPRVASQRALAGVASARGGAVADVQPVKSPSLRPSYGLVVGLGDPVSDILVRLDDEGLASRVFTTCGIDEPGGCLPVDTDEDIQRLLSVCSREWVDGAGLPNLSTDDAMVAEPVYCPGGSAANVMKGIANLGGEASFVGMVGKDEVGRRYRELLAAQNVRPVLLEAPDKPGESMSPNSAQCLSLVEKGGQRTMRTYLGASLRMDAANFPEDEALDGARLLHVEGYTLYRPELAKAAMQAAKARGATVSLDLASFEVVRNCRSQLIDILNSGAVDLLFANEDEAEQLMRFFDEEPTMEGGVFTRADADRAMAIMLRYCQVATISLGARGCVTMDADGNRGVAPGVRVPVVDTTGAGDSFTAGFLHAYLSGAKLQACASAGCAVATQVVQVLGAELTAIKWGELKGDVHGIIERLNKA